MKTYISNEIYNIYVSKNTALESFVLCIFDYFLYLSIKKDLETVLPKASDGDLEENITNCFMYTSLTLPR